MSSILKIVTALVVFLFMIPLIIYSNICKFGVERGLIVCANVIIPSLFPFLVCILIIMNMNFSFKNKYFSKIIFVCFGQNFEMFLIMLFSMLGGYPIGCKLINELYTQNKISIKTANIMQIYCINAGPAFIINAVGCEILNSKKLGILLFVSHITASLILAFLASKEMQKNSKNYKPAIKNTLNFSNVFVKSIADATQSVITICVYVVLFSVINGYLIHFLKDIPILNNIIYFTEVTTSITYTNNIFLISFLLGISGISIWFQIFSLSKNAKIDLKLFVLGRILHGSISWLILKILCKLFKFSKTVFCNNQLKEKEFLYDKIAVSLSLTIMMIIFLIFIYSKNNSRKIIDDVI